MYVEPRSKVASSSVHSSDYNIDISGQTTHSKTCWAISSRKASLESDREDDLNDSDFEDNVDDDDDDVGAKEKQNQRSTSFTKMSISPSESDSLNELGESLDKCEIRTKDDIEASIAFKAAKGDDYDNDCLSKSLKR